MSAWVPTAVFSLLVVLDNCEHLIDAAAALAEALLAHAPQVKLLATSQVALHLPGEQVYRLGALGLPAPVLHRHHRRPTRVL